ncbi:MAG: hypothetical protein ACYTEE_04445 [Planctomycetota bacterium]|jgi:opacity protein-like surface antigen
MKHKTIFLILILTIILSTLVFAVDPLGPTTAELNQNQWHLGFDYIYSNMDWDLDVVTVDDVKQRKWYGNVGYGINKNWDVFVRVGGADAEIDDDFESNFGFAVGAGTKATLYREGKFRWGLMGQTSYADIDGWDDISATIGGDTYALVDTETEIWDIQVATGPTIKLDSHFTVYGGGFYYYMDGDFDTTGTINGVPVAKGSLDITEDSSWGGYGGLQINWDKHSRLNVEYQRTAAGYAVGTQIIYRF